jgi:hypothetical protein
MGTLASELGPHVGSLSDQPRVYVDANLPARLVGFMRDALGWDVLFVIEHSDLRRARDGEHFRLARELRRTLITLDRDYLDDRAFPPSASGGVIVLAAPTEGGLMQILKRVDRQLLRGLSERETAGQPLVGRKLHVHVDWTAAPLRPGGAGAEDTPSSDAGAGRRPTRSPV